MDNIPMRNSALKAIAEKRVAQENGTKTIDPPVKRSQSVDPDTGAITYRQSWSGSENKSVTPRKTGGISSVGSKVKPSENKTSGAREFTSVPIPKAAQKTDTEIKGKEITPETKFTPKTQKERVVENKISDYNKNKSKDESFDDYRKRTQQKANENSAKAKSNEQSGSILTNKNKGTTCKTC